jgi:hypothetical protein
MKGIAVDANLTPSHPKISRAWEPSSSSSSSSSSSEHSHHSSHKASFKKPLLKLDVKFSLPMFNGYVNPEKRDNWI